MKLKNKMSIKKSILKNEIKRKSIKNKGQKINRSNADGLGPLT
jgi:hypothetical protein